MPTFNYKNTAISYTLSGRGPAIVLLHGFLENQSIWHFHAVNLSFLHTVITIDLLGHGQSECLGYIHTMEENAAMVIELLKHLEIEKAHFVGHSMGGYVVLAIADLMPQWVKSLVLLNSTALPDSEERQQNRNRAIQLIKKDCPTYISMCIHNLFSEKTRSHFTAAIEQLKVEALQTPVQGIIASLEGMKIRKDRVFILKEKNYKKLIILGQNDSVLPIEEQKKSLKNTFTKMVVLEGGHVSFIENKLELLDALVLFFKKP
ncbi:alpha/beta fold hydrolase [Flavobacterium branchiophilum]|uniref:Alpha/beta hydrolase n=2 Tax=Flavobacterium branchiophilum TaxID=55197 RepID=A0A2H3KKG6_9FLAO|nr:alpha/beta hydrolase [Flavobacterium branchiophilum]PDS25619.1 alpha/beta hydrolase [Flavobacterium branchiophilum]